MDNALLDAEPTVLQLLNAQKTRHACLTECYKALQIRHGYLSDIRFILKRWLGDLTILALQRQTHVVIAIKEAKICATYNEARLLREHLSWCIIGNPNQIQLHVIYKPLLRLKLRCDVNTPPLSESQLAQGFPVILSDRYINITSVHHNILTHRCWPTPDANSLRYTILCIKRDIIGTCSGPGPDHVSPSLGYKGACHLVQHTLMYLVDKLKTIMQDLRILK
jgi:hypothetical protein